MNDRCCGGCRFYIDKDGNRCPKIGYMEKWWNNIHINGFKELFSCRFWEAGKGDQDE